MTLTRDAYAHAKYPWEYSTAELSSLFGVTRDTQLLQPGEMQSSGWVEALKMLEQQLNFLNDVPRYRGSSGIEYVLFLWFYSGPNFQPSYETTSNVSVSSIRKWIDSIRLYSKLPAWNWSTDFDSNFALSIIDQVKEMWYATGLIHESAQFGLPATGILLNHATPYFDWANDEYGPWQYFEEVGGGYGKSYAYRSLRGFPEATRKKGVASYILFRHGGPISQTFIGNDELYIAHTVDISTVSDAFFGNQGWFTHPDAGELADPYVCLNNPDVTGEDGSRQIGIVEPSLSAYPTSGSGPVYCRFQIGTYYNMDYMTFWTPLEDQSPLCGLSSGSRGIYNDTYLWQVVTSNPYS